MAVTVVGAGIAGLACARALTAAGVPVTVLDRGRSPGGRLGRRTIGGRPVDTGAAYLTVSDPAFAAVVAGWRERGLAREWTDTAEVWRDGQREAPAKGPMRWATPRGLRSLAADLADGLAVHPGVEVRDVTCGRVDGVEADAVVLAMPDPQARRLVDEPALDREWAPGLVVAAGWAHRCWHRFDLAFVNDHPVLASVADDGARRGDAAPVLVAQTTPSYARRYLADPPAAVPGVLAAIGELFDTDAPVWAEAVRWAFAAPLGARAEPYLLDGWLGVCGDGWGGRPRVEAAWLSGHRLGAALAAQLGAAAA